MPKFDELIKKYAREIETLVHNEKIIELIDSKLVFVIISFLPKMESIFEGIKSASDLFDLDAKRVLDIQGDIKITDKIMELIKSSNFVIADLSEQRPNVYFELGYARGLGKTIITVARKETPLHFDVKDWKCYFYSDSRDLEKYLISRFEYELKNNKSL